MLCYVFVWHGMNLCTDGSHGWSGSKMLIGLIIWNELSHLVTYKCPENLQRCWSNNSNCCSCRLYLLSRNCIDFSNEYASFRFSLINVSTFKNENLDSYCLRSFVRKIYTIFDIYQMLEYFEPLAVAFV